MMSLYEAISLLEDLVYYCAEIEDMSDCEDALRVIREHLG